MNGQVRTAEASAPKRRIMLVALVGIGLLGVVLGGWIDGVPTGGERGAQGVVAVQPPVATVAPQVVAGRDRSGPTNPGVLLIVAMLLIVPAFLGVRRLLLDRGEAGVRDRTTGLFLPAYVTEAVRHLAARDDRNRRSQLALVNIGVEFLDEVQRNYNAAAADELVNYAGRLIRGQTREGDLPSRAGDEGFAIFLQCEDHEQAMAYCRRLSVVFAREQLEVRGDVFKVSASMGVVMRELGESHDNLQQRAAAKLAEARADGVAGIAG